MGNINEGDTVKVKSFNNQYGKIIEVMEGSFRVLIGTLKLVVTYDDLIQLDQPKAKFWIMDDEPEEYKKQTKKYTVMDFNIDLHGFSQEDALSKVKQSIEEARHYKAYKIQIMHGKGTGTLRIVVHSLLKQLKSNNTIKNYEFATVNQGGHGVTVVYI